jgi:hypothetical protein
MNLLGMAEDMALAVLYRARVDLSRARRMGWPYDALRLAAINGAIDYIEVRQAIRFRAVRRVVRVVR